MPTVHINIDSRLAFHEDEITKKCFEELTAAFEHQNPEFYKKQAMGFWTGDTDPEIATWRREEDLLTLPRGGMQRLRGILHEHGYDWKVTDNRTTGDPDLAGSIPEHTVALWDYQDDAVEAAIAKQNCIVRAPTGSGKTTAALALVSRLNLPTLVIVYNTGLFEQWAERCVKEFGMARSEIGVIRGSTFKVRPITIAMQQTLNTRSAAQMEELRDAFGVVLCDEVQRFGAATFFKTIDFFPARYRIGISADETRKDKKEFLIYDVFGPIAYTVSADLLIDRKFVLDVEVRVIPTDFEDAEYRSQVEDDDKNPDFGALVEKLAADKKRNELAMSFAHAEVTKGNQTLFFSHRREHCRALATIATEYGMRCGLLLGGHEDRSEFAATVAGLRDKSLLVGAGTLQAIGQGIDLPTVSRGVVTTPIAGNRQFMGQVRGRFCRTADGKDDAAIYYLWDHKVVGAGHLKNLVKWNRTVRVLENNRWVEGSRYLERYNANKK